MFKVIVDNHIPFILMGVFVATGVVSKLVVSITLKKLVKAASDMSKSSHSLMRLVRAKFEHACMVSDKVQNVEVFAKKYLYEYRVCGMRLHRLQRVETGSAWMCLLTGAFGAFAGYQVYGMSEAVFRTGATGAVEAVLLFLLHKTTDEKYQLEAVKTYMVDYLENVCAHRLEKAMKKEEKVNTSVRGEFTGPERSRLQEFAGSECSRMQGVANQEITRPQEATRLREEIPGPLRNPEISQPVSPDTNTTPNPMPELAPPLPNEMPGSDEVSAPTSGMKVVQAAKQNVEGKNSQKKQEDKKEKKQVPKEVLIREILEEFLA